MSTTAHPVNPSLERVQIKRLARVALVLSSIAAVPGSLGSLYLLLFAVGVIGDMFRAFGHVDYEALLMLTLFLSASVLGWWLYSSYWREMDGNNQGIISWLISALFNGALSIFSVITLFFSNVSSLGEQFWLISLLLWTLTMTVISVRVWLLKARY